MSEESQRTCVQMGRLLLLYVCEELEEAERAAVELHLRGCAACAAAAEREREWLAGVAARPAEPVSPHFLAQCRSSLADALDRSDEPGFWKRLAESLRPRRWFALHPALSASTCVVLGLALGLAVSGMLRTPPQPAPAAVVPLFMPASGSDLDQVQVSGFTAIPASDNGTVNVVFQLKRPEVLQGTLNDQNVRRVLMRVASDTQHFDSGLRLDSVELLRAHSADDDVRGVLLRVARNDRNPGVRLKALESLRGFVVQPDVRRAFLEALQHDENPGARVEAINALRAVLDQPDFEPDAQLVDVLRDRMKSDTNTYIRLQSAAAVRQIAAREPF